MSKKLKFTLLALVIALIAIVFWSNQSNKNEFKKITNEAETMTAQ